MQGSSCIFGVEPSSRLTKRILLRGLFRGRVFRAAEAPGWDMLELRGHTCTNRETLPWALLPLLYGSALLWLR